MDEESIFAEAVKIQSDSERKAFLDQVCDGNAQLRAEVEELLRANAAAGSFLNHPPTGPDPVIDAKSAAEETIETDVSQISLSFLEPCDKPDRIGKLSAYEIIEVVGRGGMGIVLRAYDAKLCRTVAVKVLAPELAANPMAVKRFLSEAQKAAAVVHDHVVTIHAVDDAHRPPFLVMEFIEGQTLQQKIDDEGALQLMPILRIGIQMAEGLAAAHQRGLIHRDVKPANILLENGVERVKITDFGLARAIDDVRVTRTGQVAGTPLYMSPEQAQGEPVDHRSDLFSLGSVLYTTCTGRPAFRSDSHLAVMRRVCEDAPRAIQEVNPDIPEWLIAVIERLLNKDPDRRLQSAEEVADLLGRHLAHMQTPTQAPQPAALSASEFTRGTTPRLHWRIRYVLVAVVLAAALVGVTIWQFLPRPPHPGAVQWSVNGHWYLPFVAAQPVSWEEAQREAEAWGGHLVTITSSGEEEFVIRLINDAKYWSRNPENGTFEGPWIGALQLEGAREPDGGWRWVTGEPFLYSDWTSGQPNDGRSPYRPQQHVFYWREKSEWLSARWGDATGGSPGRKYVRSFIIEFDGLPIPKSHSDTDPYTSLIVSKGSASNSLVITDEHPVLRQMFGEVPRTSFMHPGIYRWEILDGSRQNQLIANGDIEFRAGQRIAFTADGHPPQVLEDDSESPAIGAVQWSTSEGGNGHWYLVGLDPNGVRWDEAKSKAEAMNGHLVTITSQAENEFVVRLIDDARYWRRNPDNKVFLGPWIGAMQLDGSPEPDSGWRWVTGEPFEYSDWQPSQPNDIPSSLTQQQYIRLVTFGSNWLNAQWGDASLPVRSYIVEFDNKPVLTKDDFLVSDPYGVISVPASSEQTAVVVKLNKNDLRRFRFNQSHTSFVAPGVYQWELLDLSQPLENRQIRVGEVEIKAGERIVFTSEGPRLPPHNADAGKTPNESPARGATAAPAETPLQDDPHD